MSLMSQSFLYSLGLGSGQVGPAPLCVARSRSTSLIPTSGCISTGARPVCGNTTDVIPTNATPGPNPQVMSLMSHIAFQSKDPGDGLVGPSPCTEQGVVAHPIGNLCQRSRPESFRPHHTKAEVRLASFSGCGKRVLQKKSPSQDGLSVAILVQAFGCIRRRRVPLCPVRPTQCRHHGPTQMA